jgi:hypothetical protein
LCTSLDLVIKNDIVSASSGLCTKYGRENTFYRENTYYEERTLVSVKKKIPPPQPQPPPPPPPHPHHHHHPPQPMRAAPIAMYSADVWKNDAAGL